MPQREKLKLIVKAGVVTALGVGALSGVASPASAQGIGNGVYNCYGYWFNTAWGQACTEPGSSKEGTYHSHAACSSQADHDLYVHRAVNTTDAVKGPDCTFSVTTVSTEFTG